MDIKFSGSIQIERVQGKFASRDELIELIQSELDDALQAIQPYGLGADGTSEYEITDYDLDVQ